VRDEAAARANPSVSTSGIARRYLDVLREVEGKKPIARRKLGVALAVAIVSIITVPRVRAEAPIASSSGSFRYLIVFGGSLSS